MTHAVSEQPSQIAVIGGGTWGATLAGLLCAKGFGARVWDVDAALLERLRATRRHPNLAALELPAAVEFHDDLNRALRDAESIVIAVPSVALRGALERVRDAAGRPPHPIYILCTKGIEFETGLTMRGVALEVLGRRQETSIGVLSGPSHAEEVAQKIPTSVVAAAEDPAVAQYVQSLFLTPVFRPYTQQDVLGVELGGALKNVIAIAGGVCDGLGFGDNTRAALLTRGLAEMTRLAVALGAEAATLAGLSGLGDLIVTATSRHSRNRKFGELLARIGAVDEALARVGMVVEGMPTSRAALKLAQRHQIVMPITEEVVRVIFEGKNPQAAVRDLLAREAKPEIY